METTPPIKSVPRISGMEIIILAVIALCVAVSALVWKKGSDRAGCITNIRNVQQAVRSYQGMNNETLGGPINWSEILGPGKFLPKPVCPASGTYTFSKVHPNAGQLVCKCSHANHVPDDHTTW